MTFFDFIGNQPNQVSLPELLAGLAIPAGAALMYRQGRLGGPIGAALTGFGGLGLALGQRQQQAAQQAQLAQQTKSLGKLFGPQSQDFFDQAASVNMGPSDALAAWRLKSQPPKTEQQRPVNVGGREFSFNPATGTFTPAANVPVVPSKPEKPTTFEQEEQLFKTNPALYRQMKQAGERPEKPPEVSYTPVLNDKGQVIGRWNNRTGTMEPTSPLSSGPAYKGKPPGPAGTKINIPMPPTEKTVGGYIYTLSRKHDGSLVYKLANPPAFSGLGGPPAELPGPALLPPGLVTYTRPDGSLGFAMKKAP